MSNVSVFFYKPTSLSDMEGLIKAARVGDLDEAIRLVERDGEDVNKVGPQYNLTPLHLASLHGHRDVAEFLIDKGANPDALDDWKCTPLHNAAGAGHADIVKELLEAGADTEVRSSNKGRTPMEIAREKGKFDVVPILQAYVTKNRDKKNKAGGSGGSGGRGGGRGGSKGGGRDQASNARSVGGGSKQPRAWQERLSKVNGGGRSNGGSGGGGNNMSLPGQIGGSGGNGGGGEESREQSAAFGHEKRALQRQLNRLNKQEEMYRLAREHDKTREKFELTKGKYDRDLEELITNMEQMQARINGLAGQRDEELTDMESKLHELQDKMYEMEREGSPDSGKGSSR